MNFEKRIDKLIRLLRKKGLDAAILTSRSNTRYFTGIRFNTTSFSILFVSERGNIVFLVPTLDYKRVKKDCWIRDVRQFPEDNPNYLAPLKKVLSDNMTRQIGVEFPAISIEGENLIKEVTNAILVNIDSDLSTLRSIKTKEEVELIRASAKIADEAMTKALESVKDGMREYEVSAIALNVMMKEGAEGPSFEPFVMSGENAWLPQRFSSKKELKRGEMILFDMGCILDGYCSDITRTFSLGGLSDEQKELFKIAYEAQKRTVAAIKPGVSGGDVDKVAREYIAQNGYGKHFPHLTGHGLGLSIHEMPILDEDFEVVLEPGMVVTVEPGIYVEGIGAARIEDMVLITEDGFSLLTGTPRDLIDIGR
ncbi:M24 family metallopeptidase [Acetomicrobium sp. UBA5826]|uniref:M24 family metallopeptidase n=1 Tax=Acetomicrobium sp. UBA5826 TaxID=1946039 RepID=UPI0025808CD8|nr:Xaa-Pro peptidase family protein [Acetomicrobium sp. UBA5826]